MVSYLRANCQANLKNHRQVLRTPEILFSSLFLSGMSVIHLEDNRARPPVVLGPRCERAASLNWQYLARCILLRHNQNTIDGTRTYKYIIMLAQIIMRGNGHF